MSRIADLFSNGAYSRALAERNKLADAGYGSSGFARSQTEAMKYAKELARGNAARQAGQQLSNNASKGERIANAANVVPSTNAADMFHKMDTEAVKGAEGRIAQAQANALNNQARFGQGMEQAANALTAGLTAYGMKQKENQNNV